MPSPDVQFRDPLAYLEREWSEDEELRTKPRLREYLLVQVRQTRAWADEMGLDVVQRRAVKGELMLERKLATSDPDATTVARAMSVRDSYLRRMGRPVGPVRTHGRVEAGPRRRKERKVPPPRQDQREDVEVPRQNQDHEQTEASEPAA